MDSSASGGPGTLAAIQGKALGVEMKEIVVGLLGAILLTVWCEPRAVAQQTNGQAQAGQQSAAGQPPSAGENDPQRRALHQRYPRYRVRPSDVYVQGLTVAETEQALRKAYSGILNDPEISITLKDFDRPYFVAGGFVGKPGKYDLRGATTASQAVAIAGGFADGAKNSQVVLFRRANSDDWVEVKVLNLKEVMKGKNLNEDTVLQPGDMLYVPKSTWAKIEKFLPRSSLGAYFSPALL